MISINNLIDHHIRPVEELWLDNSSLQPFPQDQSNPPPPGIPKPRWLLPWIRWLCTISSCNSTLRPWSLYISRSWGCSYRTWRHKLPVGGQSYSPPRYYTYTGWSPGCLYDWRRGDSGAEWRQLPPCCIRRVKHVAIPFPWPWFSTIWLNPL